MDHDRVFGDLLDANMDITDRDIRLDELEEIRQQAQNDMRQRIVALEQRDHAFEQQRREIADERRRLLDTHERLMQAHDGTPHRSRRFGVVDHGINITIAVLLAVAACGIVAVLFLYNRVT